MREDTALTDLLSRAEDGDQEAWDELVHRYAPLVWSICRRYQLSPADIDDINQTVWLLLVEHLGNLRTPAALPGWLATTTRRECLRVLRVSQRYEFVGSAADLEAPADPLDQLVERDIIAAEDRAALRTAFGQLPARCRQLLSMLMGDPPAAYAQISAAVAIPIGSIGPQRARCLNRMRRSPALAGLSDGDISPAGQNRANPSPGDKAYA